MTKTDAVIIKTQEDFLNNNFTSHFIARVRKGCVGFYCERELETKHNWNILTPKLWPSALCLSRSPGLLNRRPRAHSAWWWLSLVHLISIFSGPQFIRAPSPFGLVWLSLPLSFLLELELNCLVELNWVIYSFDAHTIFEIECLIVIKRK